MLVAFSLRITAVLSTHGRSHSVASCTHIHSNSLNLLKRALAVSTIGVGGVRDGRTDARNAEASMYETSDYLKAHKQTHTRGTVRGEDCAECAKVRPTALTDRTQMET